MLKDKFYTVCWTLVTSTINISKSLLLQTHVLKILVSTGTCILPMKSIVPKIQSRNTLML